MIFTFTSHKKIPDILTIEGQRFSDSRGYFEETMRCDKLMEYGIPIMVQENHSSSKANVFRGLHFQKDPKGQAKLVSCVRGEIYDFIVDIRKGSHTYGKYIRIHLTEYDTKQIYIPVGFLHGFLTLPKSNITDVVYKVSEYYSQEYEQSVSVMDPDLNIVIPDGVEISNKDRCAPLLKEIDNDFCYGQ